MGAATKGGGAVSKGPRNKVLSKPSTKIKVMMKKGGEVKASKRGGRAASDSKKTEDAHSRSSRKYFAGSASRNAKKAEKDPLHMTRGSVKKYNKGGPADPTALLQKGQNPSMDRAYNDPALGHQAAMKRAAEDEKRKASERARRAKTRAGAKKASKAAKTKKGRTTRGGSGTSGTSGLAGSSVKLMRKGGKVNKYRKGGALCG